MYLIKKFFKSTFLYKIYKNFKIYKLKDIEAMYKIMEKKCENTYKNNIKLLLNL
jgi:hypothetical protein